jgi:hypothetical protein
MTRYTIDAPTLLRLVSEEVEVHPDHQLVAPQAIRSQALQMMLDRVRAGELTTREANRLHTLLTETRIRVLGDRMSRWTAFRLAEERGWPHTSVAEYVAVTKLQADALVTIDEDLAALVEGVVPLAPFSALVKP